MKFADIRTRKYEDGNFAVEICNESAGITVYFGKDKNEAHRQFVKQLEAAAFAEYGLKDYYEWKAWLLADKEAHGYTDYDDNWLFCASDVVSVEYLQTTDFFGKRWYLTKETHCHKISGKVYEFFEVYDNKSRDFSHALCGLKY